MTTDLEKGAIQQPASTHHPNLAGPDDFPPTYEEHVNSNLRNFNVVDFHDVKLTEFDTISDAQPKQRKRKCPAWVWFTISGSLLLLICALLGGLIIHYAMHKSTGQANKVPTAVSSISQTVAIETKLSQTSVHTRSEETITLAPETTTVFITQTPSTSLTLPTLTSQASGITITPVSVSTHTITTALEPSTISTLNSFDLAVSSSIAAEMSRMSDILNASPAPTTLVSVSTTTEISVSTPPPIATKSRIPMPGGRIDWCGINGQSCNERRQKRDLAKGRYMSVRL